MGGLHDKARNRGGDSESGYVVYSSNLADRRLTPGPRSAGGADDRLDLPDRYPTLTAQHATWVAPAEKSTLIGQPIQRLRS